MKTEHLSKVKDTLLAENNLFKVHEPNDENNFPSDCLPPVLGDYFEELADKYDISQDLACPLGLGVISCWKRSWTEERNNKSGNFD